jgi:hypothetical protein
LAASAVEAVKLEIGELDEPHNPKYVAAWVEWMLSGSDKEGRPMYYAQIEEIEGSGVESEQEFRFIVCSSIQVTAT